MEFSLMKSISPSTRIRSSVSVCLLVLILMQRSVHGDEGKRWPEKAGEFAATIAAPPGFMPVRPHGPALASRAAQNKLLDARFRSVDRKVEFAVTVYYVRHLPQTTEKRRIAAIIADGEKVIERKTSRKRFTGEHGDYWLYDEELSVAGDGYTRYLLNSFSTGTLPGASSVLWEFRAADDNSRRRYAPLYRRFKDSLDIGED
jgi:hypothetical protein